MMSSLKVEQAFSVIDRDGTSRNQELLSTQPYIGLNIRYMSQFQKNNVCECSIHGVTAPRLNFTKITLVTNNLWLYTH
jgi:hypothetical protein